MVLSPAKTLDFDSAPIITEFSNPMFAAKANSLVKVARKLDPQSISDLMGVSQSIAHLNYERFMKWQLEATPHNAKQAVLAFKGDVYAGLRAETLSAAELNFAQEHLRILSGLYGLLRPLDLMQPYRLEMGLNFGDSDNENLYDFWGDALSDALNLHLKKLNSEVLINLASNEYFRAIKRRLINARILTPQFKDLKNGKYRIISFYAKRARGLMANYVITRNLTEPEALKDFTGAGYYYSEEESTELNWVFLRDMPEKN